MRNKSVTPLPGPGSKTRIRTPLYPPTYLLLVASLSGCTSFVNSIRNQSPPPESSPQTSKQISDGPSQSPLPSSRQSDFVVDAVEQVRPAVVRIDAHREAGLYAAPSFDRQLPFGDEWPQGQGSGFITRSDGIVLTNHHVVEGADSVTVTLSDGRSYRGTVLGSDAVSDLGIVKIDANNLPVAALGDSAEVKPGEWAIAIGNPLGLDSSVSLGIISATDRTTGVPGGSRVPYIQTDAAINPGNSGGPLINDRAQVIGINTFIRTAPGGGLSFAIPINKARDIGEQIIARGRASHPFIGVSLRRITPELAREINKAGAGCQYPETTGVAVVEVLADRPAEQAGIVPCDVIRSVAGVPVQNPAQVQVQVDRGRVGEPLPLGIERQGAPRTLLVIPKELQTEPL